MIEKNLFEIYGELMIQKEIIDNKINQVRIEISQRLKKQDIKVDKPILKENEESNGESDNKPTPERTKK